ncbi:fumarate reductase flavoprotein subunit [Thermomonospora echinospora]|uniref:Fumarate reductase flavoprotein subunit n=1 Tax=Thermomonospora echinospora TaxID=1992 RepID=A0A1H6C1E1_9ACTN|nr:FAD-dependent oxidoreductase [Thermomonospora echinospora]SEG66186.1 fumarate reductase flavoprotein subunit [Thermomonospora echinospora]
MSPFDYEVDVAVVGGGACGLVTALRAARSPGLTVAVFEKSTREGCNAQISSGSLAAGGTRFQRAAGIDDSPARHARDILAVSGDTEAAPLVHAVCEAAPRYVEWLADELGHPLELGLDMARSGQSVPRLHTDVGRGGGALLVRTLRRAVETAANIAFLDATPGTGLLSEDGRVTGVLVRENGRTRRVGARAVVLAADGFAANTEMLAEHCPDACGAFYGGVGTSTGDAISWGVALGAGTRNMSAYLGHGMIVPGHGTRLNPVLPFLGALLVGSDGRRFADERAQGYSRLGRIIAARPDGRAVLIWDDRMHDTAMNSELMRQSQEAGAFRRHPDLAALATALALPAEALAETLRMFRAVSSDGDHGPLSFPLYAARVTHGILATQGGLTVDTTGHVLHASGRRIPNLYAGGGSAAGISGPSTEGYMSGNGLLAALGLGWIIGNHLAVTLPHSART